MKKKVLFLLAAVLSLAAQAQKFEEVQKRTIEEYIVPIPGTFTCDGKARAAVGVINSYGRSQYDSYKIIDENLKEEASIKVENVVKPYTLIKARAYELKGEFRENVSRYYDSSVFDIALEDFDVKAFASWMYSNGDGEAEVPSYVILKETARTSTSVAIEVDFNESALKKYMVDEGLEELDPLKGIFVFSANNSQSCYVDNCDVSEYVYKRVYNGEWKEEKIYDDVDLIIMSYDDMTVPTESKLYVTQSLFNSDKAYECIQPILELEEGDSSEYDRDNDGKVDSLRVIYEPYAVGFQIVQDDGNVISSVKFGDGWYGGRYYDGFGILSYMRFDDKNYIVAKVKRKNGDGKYENASIFYSFTPGNPSSIKAVRTENHGIKATPAIARQSEKVSIDVSKFSNPRRVMVVGSNGQTMMQQTIAEGASNVQISTTGLPAGLYVVKVSDGKNASDNCKIIIR